MATKADLINNGAELLQTSQEETPSAIEYQNEQRRKVFPAIEYEPTDIPLSEVYKDGILDIYPQVKGKDFFRIYSKQDRLVFQAGSYIGLIPINDRVALDVRSRVPIKNMERVLQIAERKPVALNPHFRQYAVHEDSAPSLLDLLAQSFIDSTGEIETFGLHREYIQRTSQTSFPRGRILLGETLRLHEARGIKHRVSASWFEHSADTALNRCLKYTIWYLFQKYSSMKPRKGSQGLIAELNRLYYLFDGIELDKNRSFLNDRLVVDPNRIPSIRAYYKASINIAVTIIRDRGVAFDVEGDEILLPSLLIDFDKVFENYLRAILRSKIHGFSYDMYVLDGNEGGEYGGKKMLFDSLPSEAAKPDIVFKLEVAGKDNSYPLLIEAKYKKFIQPSREDINQAISYGVSYRCERVVIAHPRIEGLNPGLHKLGTIGSLTLYQYVFDLGAENPEDEEEKLMESMLSLL